MSRTPIPADKDLFTDGTPEDDETSMLVKVQGGMIFKRVLPEDLMLGASGVKVNCFCNIYSGINQLKSVFNNQELDLFKQTVFGCFMGIGELKFVQGQLFTLLVLNYLEPIARKSSVECLNFQISDRVVCFKKSDYALIVGMKFGDEGDDENMKEYIPGSFCKKFFKGKMSVARGKVGAEFLRAGKSKRRNPLETVKLGLLHLLVNHMTGNQDRTTIPALYMHLVEDLERFNAYPWGEHLWADLVESVRRGCMILKSSEIWRFTFPGFLFPLQIWAFETFAGLEDGKICQRRHGWQSLRPRSLRWNTGVKPRFSALDSAIFGVHKHMQVVFYFMRMKGREFGHDQRYTTTDPSFMMLLCSLYQRYLKKEVTAAEAARNSNIMGTIVGGRPEYGRAWKESDYVYMPLAISSHWILLVLDIHEKTIRLYDSNTRRGASLRNLQQHLPCLQTFLPKILDILGVYDQNAAGDSVLSVEGVPGCPQQSDGSSCGVFVIKYAENLMMGKGLQGIDAAKINDYRKKLAVELLTYASIGDLKNL